MVILFLFLVLTEIFSLSALKQHLYTRVKILYYAIISGHAVLSIWLWVLFFRFVSYHGYFDDPEQVWRLMMLAGMICAVVFPRILLILCHFSGKIIRRKAGGHISWLTNAGLAASVIVFLTVAVGTIKGRFNLREEHVTVRIRDLNTDLRGLKIVQISDLHLSCFYHHMELLDSIIRRLNDYKPDILINTGDFVTFGWREFGRCDTILVKARGRYGTFAIMGNHDAGTYHPDYSPSDIENNVIMMNTLVSLSGYTVLNNSHSKIRIGNTSMAVTGVISKGRHPNIIHGDIGEAIAGLDSVSFNMLLTHDPNHWLEAVAGKRDDIALTLSGHTHGMQMGIITEKFRWSPSKYFFPHWNGLYGEGGQQHYVNRGLGVLAVPFRIWMPPEITIITLEKE